MLIGERERARIKEKQKKKKIRKHALYRMIYRNSRETSEKNN